MKILKAIILVVLISDCTQKDEFVLGVEYKTVEISCESSKSKIDSKHEGSLKNSVIISVEDLVSEIKNNYNFSALLPRRFEYCGEIPIYFCSVGEPDKYYAIDTLLKEEIIIKIETNKHDQANYDFVFPEKRDSLIKLMTSEELEWHTEVEHDFGKMKGLVQYNPLKPTKSNIKNSYYYGSGYNGVTKKGCVKSEYNIYGYDENILLSIFYRSTEEINENIINELYCILSDVKIVRNKK